MTMGARGRLDEDIEKEIEMIDENYSKYSKDKLGIMRDISHQADLDIAAAKRLKEDTKFARKPLWVQQNEEGDRMSDGSDDQEYEEENV